jgi:serine/threonine protein kinase
MIGKTLAHYEISAELGRGGMGEVYQAKDTKLGRDVAIKVLPEEFARDTDRVARFQREAKLLASLNHPNIAAIYGLEESDGTHFLVMELIEGETLKDRIKTGPIPVEEALKFALQMAEALEAAHEKGVIHRDLKPANIKVTSEGKVKILDFGLAKAYVGDQGSVNLADSPTISAAATQQGVILGTAAYMSPEQARGKSVDRRADIWAFGVVLYEMLTGKTAFSGTDVTDTLAAVIRSEPEWKRLPANLHWRLREVLERCLEKQAKDRYSGISDARVEIQKVLGDPSGIFAIPISTVEPRRKLRFTLALIAATVILTAVIVGIVVWNLKTTEPPKVIRLNHELPMDQEFTNIGRPVVAISSDGMNIVYVANRQLYLRNLNELTARPIQGTEINPTTPFFSPDGKWVGFYSPEDSQLKKITVSGGAPVTLCSATNPFGVTWGDDDSILFGQETGILRVSANGGPADVLIAIEEGEYIHGPQLLPDREWVLFTFAEDASTAWDEAQIVVQSLKSGERKVLISGGSDARYVPTGHLVYALGGVLYAIRFDADSLEVIGGAVPVVEAVQRAYGQYTGTANYGFSDNGMLAYVVGSADTTAPPRRLVWADREGKEEPLSAEPKTFFYPRLSPDGSKVALVIPDGDNQDIWIWDIVRETMTRLTFFEGQDIQPIWTPDGNRIVFFSAREEGGVYWKNADGTGEAEFFGSVPDRLLFPWCFSKDGSSLINGELIGEDRMDIGMLLMEGDHEHKPLLTEEYVEMQPKISPDGRWMAYTASESDNWGVYVRPFPDVNKGKWQVSPDIGIGPLWSPDGKELFYRSPDGIMAVPVDTEPTFKLGKPKVLFPDTYISLLGGGFEGHAWDIHPDGKRFLMMKLGAVGSTEETSRPNINIVLNWFEELKQRVPVD